MCDADVFGWSFFRLVLEQDLRREEPVVGLLPAISDHRRALPRGVSEDVAQLDMPRRVLRIYVRD